MPIRKLSDIVNENFQRNLGQISAAPPDWLVSAYPELFAKDWEGKTYMTGGAYPGAFPTLDMSRLPEDQRARLSAEELAAGHWKDIGGGNVWAPDAADENDWLAPVSMIASYGLNGALQGAFSGLGGVEGAALPAGMEYTAQAAGGMEPSSLSVTDVGGDVLAQGPGPWANTPPYPDYASQLVNGTTNYGQLGAQLGEVGFSTPGSVGYIPLDYSGGATGSFRNPDGSFGSTAANSAVGGAGVAASAGASGGNTPWMTDPGMLGGLSSALGLSGITGADLFKMAGSALPGLMGAYASSKQSDTLAGLAKEYAAYGAPSRARYEASFAPGFSMAQDPGYQDALDASSKATMRSMSVNGNPAGSPNAWAATMKDTYDRTAYPALQQYRNQNAATSGIANFNAAAPGVQTGQVQANANIWNGIGSAIGNVTNPAPTLAEIMKMYGGGGGNDIFKVGP